MLPRLIAVVTAVALVLGALAVRNNLDDEGDAGAGNADGPIRLVCARELADACGDLEGGDVSVVVEDASTTADRLAGGNGRPDLDAWLTIDPWPAMVEDARARAGAEPVLASTSDVLARSPLVIVAKADRADVLARACATTSVEWSCVGQHAGASWASLGGDETWGSVRPGHLSPDTSASGLAVLAQASASYAGRADLSANDLDDPAYRRWLTTLERSVPTFTPSASSPVEEVLQRPTYDVVGTTEADATTTLERSPGRRGSLTIFYPQPMVTADVVLVSVGGGALPDSLGSDASRALAGAGWRDAGTGGSPPAGAPLSNGEPVLASLPASSGLPSAGTLAALRRVWQEVVR